jgi:hypothetical protein
MTATQEKPLSQILADFIESRSDRVGSFLLCTVADDGCPSSMMTVSRPSHGLLLVGAVELSKQIILKSLKDGVVKVEEYTDDAIRD